MRVTRNDDKYYFPNDDAIIREFKKQGVASVPLDSVKDLASFMANNDNLLTHEEITAAVAARTSELVSKASTDPRSGKWVMDLGNGKLNKYNTYDGMTKATSRRLEKHTTASRDDLAKAATLRAKLPGYSPLSKAISFYTVKNKIDSQDKEPQDQPTEPKDSSGYKEVRAKSDISENHLKRMSELLDALDSLTDIEKELLSKDSNDGPATVLSGSGSEQDDEQEEADPKWKLLDLLDNAKLLDRGMLRAARHLKKFSDLTTSGNATKFKQTVEGDDIKSRPMTSVGEIGKIGQAAFALRHKSRTLFHKKLACSEFSVRELGTYLDRKQLLYILVDSSGSMQEHNAFCQAAGVALNRLTAVAAGDAEVYWRFFTGHPHQEFHAYDKDSARSSVALLTRSANYSGGSTNFDRAIVAAVSDIESHVEENPSFIKPEIMIVTDGQNEASLTLSQLKGIKLHTVFVGPTTPHYSIVELGLASGGITTSIK